MLKLLKSRTWWVWLLYALVVLYVIGEWINPSPRAHYGEQCGPNHHWVYVGSAGDLDLSCERDRELD
jgi:hypothetical protein